MSRTTTEPRARRVRLVVLIALGIPWVALLWMQSSVLGVWGVLAWVIGGIAAMTVDPSASAANAVAWRTTLRRSTQALLVAVLLGATLLAGIVVDGSISPWLLVVPIAVFAYADFWVWAFRAGLRSVRSAAG